MHSATAMLAETTLGAARTPFEFQPPAMPRFDALRWLGGVLSHIRGFDIRPVRTLEQRFRTNRLVNRMYAWRGYRTESQKHVVLDDPYVLTLAAWRQGEVIGTLTLRRDSGAGLLADALYEDEVSALRHPNRVLCEVSRLAIDPVFSSCELLNALIASAVRHGRERFSASDAVIEVNPRHARYYCQRFGFRQIGDLRRCERVDAPAVLLHQAIERITIPEFISPLGDCR